jgi:hypothetical protein
MITTKTLTIAALCVACISVFSCLAAAEDAFVDSGQSLGNGRTFSIAVGDVDEDGDLDAFMTNYIGANTVWLNDGTGIFAALGQSLNGQNVIGISSGDMNGDGNADVLIGMIEGNGGNKVYFNTSDVPTESSSWGRIKAQHNPE